MLTELLVSAGAVAPAALAFARAHKTRHPLMLQWGRFINRRDGIKGHPNWSDEPDVVEYVDFKWWIRLRPNPGINLPAIGYWSRANGRRR